MKDLLLGLLIGAIIGGWFGVNLGKDQPLLTNPFSETSDMKEISKKFKQLQTDVSQKSKELYKEAKDAVQSVDYDLSDGEPESDDKPK